MKISENSGFYPILINLQRYPCLIIGGGIVAHRKALSLLEFNADITVLSPYFCKPLIKLFKESKINIIRKTYSKEVISNYKIVFSTVDNRELSEKISRDCIAEGVLLNSADNPLLCDFILPANIIRGNLTISVASQGRAPFFTKEVKKKLDSFISPIYSEIIDLADEFRKQLLKDSKQKSKTKISAFKKFSSVDWEKVLSENGKKSKKFYVQKILSEL
jgi:siroheme synthase-like protein